MKIISALSPLLYCLSFFSQDGSYNDGISFTYKASEMGYSGKIKSVSEKKHTLDDQHLLEKGTTSWDQTNTSHLNFNQHGNLISSYLVNSKNDTNTITLVTFNSKNQLEAVDTYHTSYGKTCKPSYLLNWTHDKSTYAYENDLLVTATYTGESYHKRGNARQTISYDEKGRILQKNVISTEGELDTLYVNTYKYIGSTDKVKELNVSHCELRKSGKTIYTYDKDTVLLSKQFTPVTYTLQEEWNSEETFWEFDLAGNCTSHVLGDSLKWPVYTYDNRTYNANKDATSHTSILDYDGIGHSIYTMAYEYDLKNNWTSRKTKLLTLKMYGYGQTGAPDEFYKSERVLTYFEE